MVKEKGLSLHQETKTINTMTFSQFKQQYPDLKDVYLFCIENGKEQYFWDWFEGYETLEGSLEDLIADFLFHFNLVEQN